MERIYRIGRMHDNDIVINSDYVSGYHAELKCTDQRTCLLTDFSKNGTIVNGFMVHNDSFPVKYGDSIMFAGVESLDWNRINMSIQASSNSMGNGDTQRHNAGYQASDSVHKGGFSNAVRVCMKEKYASFKGRASRSEYWYFALFYGLVLVGAGIIGAILGALVSGGNFDSSLGAALILYCIVALAFICPSISVLVRRLHDTGRSGWYYWLCLIPWVGGIIIFIYCVLESERKDNEYGPFVE